MNDIDVEWEGDVTYVRPPVEEVGKQAVNAYFGINGVSTPSKGLSLMVTALRPGGVTKAHYHIDSETGLFMQTGSMHFFWGKDLEHDKILEPGDFLYIPPNCPHISYNRSHTVDAASVTARTDALEQEQVYLLPHLDGHRDDAVSYIN
jgi:uncharacterized RmlC-like cupin family protein